MGRKTARTKKKDDLFFMYLAGTGSVQQACAESGYTSTRVYLYRQEDDDFSKRWHIASKLSVGLVEDSLLDVLVNGDTDYKSISYIEEGVKKTEKVKIQRRYPSVMLNYVKIREPQKYSQNSDYEKYENLTGPERRKLIKDLMSDIEALSVHLDSE